MARLAQFRGIHHGEAIVVCGLGNSIRKLGDPKRFRTIGVNDIERAFTPDYMFCMDAPQAFPPDRLRYIQSSQAQFIFTDHDLGITGGNIVKFPIRRADFPELDDPDALYLIGRPSTSPFMALCLAAHMGAKAIGLIGVDFTNGHFFAADGTHKLANQLPGIDGRFYQLGSALLKRGVKIFNLSVESRLRAYPRLSPDEFWELQQSGRTRAWTRPAERLYFHASAPVDRSVEAIARFINTETSLSCRLSAPWSADILPGAAPEIERCLAAEASAELDCDIAPLPMEAPARSTFLSVWNQQVRPLLFGFPGPFNGNGFRRKMTFRVIVSQERAEAEEVAETVGSLWPDLLPADEIVVVQRHGASHLLQSWPRGSAKLRYMDQGPGESFIAARNRAAARCPQDILLFTDANIQAPARWVDPLMKAFQNPRAAAVGPAIVDMYDARSACFGMKFSDWELSTAWLPKRQDTPYPVPLLPSAFLAVRRSAFEQLEGFDPAMRQTGADDLELCLRLWTAGFECFVTPKLEVAWMNPFAAGAIRTEDYWTDLLHNLLRLATVHFCPERLGSFLAAASAHPEYSSASAGLLSHNPAARQRLVRESRRYSDDWFFERFRD